MKFKPLVLLFGAGEMGSAIAHRFYRSRFRVVLAGKEDPLTLMRGNAFSKAMFSETHEVDGVAVRKAVVTEAISLVDRDVIPLLTAEAHSILEVLNPEIVVDARFPPPQRKFAVGDASLIVGIGEGFNAGEDCDLAVITEPGHDTGRVIYRGKPPTPPAPNDSVPARELITADNSGIFNPLKRLGQSVSADEAFGEVDGQAVCPGRDGVICGLLRQGAEISRGTVLAEINPRGMEDDCYTISGHCRAVSGSVLEVATAWVADMGGFSSQE